MSFKLADEIYHKVSGIEEVFVWMYNVIGRPVNDPKAVVVRPLTKNAELDKSQQTQITEIVSDNLEKMDEFCKKLLSEQIDIA